MPLDFSQLKKIGTVIEFQNQPFVIIWSNFQRTAQRKPVVQAKLRNLITGKVLDYSFKYGERVEAADVGKSKAQFLYTDQEGAHFMDQDTYETVTLEKDFSDPVAGYLKDGMEVTLVKYGERPISVELPAKVDLEVKETPPNIKGNTATGGTKPATLETGLVVNVPLFIKEGDKIRVNTETGEYTERAN